MNKPHNSIARICISVGLLSLLGCGGQGVTTTRVGQQTAPGPAEASTAAHPNQYSMQLQLSSEHSCSRSMSELSATSALVMTFSEPNSVSVCRGHHVREVFVTRGSGPRVTDYAERQGYRGHWHQNGAFMELELAADSSVCESRGRFVQNPENMALRCRARRSIEGVYERPLLTCEVLSAISDPALPALPPQEISTYLVQLPATSPNDFPTEPELVLSSDNGLLITQSQDLFHRSLEVVRSDTALGINTIERISP